MGSEAEGEACFRYTTCSSTEKAKGVMRTQTTGLSPQAAHRLHTSPRSQPALALGGDTTPLHVKGASEGEEPDPTLHLPEVSGRQAGARSVGAPLPCVAAAVREEHGGTEF